MHWLLAASSDGSAPPATESPLMGGDYLAILAGVLLGVVLLLIIVFCVLVVMWERWRDQGDERELRRIELEGLE
jgi:hypothetical protein